MEIVIIITTIISVLPIFQAFSLGTFNDETLNSLKSSLHYSFKNFSCISLYSQFYQFNNDLFKYLFNINVPVINQVYQIHCSGYALITQNIFDAMEVLKQHEKYYTNRILLYVLMPDSELLNHLKANIEVFGEADGLIMNGNHSYIFNSALKTFSSIQISNFSEPWGDYVPTYNFLGRKISVGTFNLSVFSTIGPLDSSNKPSWFKGIEMSSFGIMAEIMNLTWDVYIPDPNRNQWGRLLPNATYDGGIYKRLFDKKIEIAMGCIWILPSHVGYFSVTPPSEMVSVRHLVRRPRLLNMEWSSVWRPFPISLWALVLLVNAINTTALAIVTKLETKINSHFVYKDYASFWNSNFLSLRILLLGGIPASMEKQGPLRQLLTSWVVTCFLLTTCFASSLVSHITTPDMEYRPETVPELVKAGYFWGAEFPPNTNIILNVSNHWHYEWARRCKTFSSKEEHLRAFENDKFILWGKAVDNIGFHLNEDYIPREELRNWEISVETLNKFFYAFALQKGSALLPAMNRYSLLLVETGHVKKLIHDLFILEGEPYMTEVFHKTKPRSVGPSTLTKENLQGIFYFYILGLATASNCFFIEFFLVKKFHF